MGSMIDKGGYFKDDGSSCRKNGTQMGERKWHPCEIILTRTGINTKIGSF